MTKTRDNHYVPQWYQRGFIEPGRSALAYVDLQPDQHMLPDGRILPGRALFTSPTSRCFVQTDLYSTFFGTAVNDEIERRLTGPGVLIIIWVVPEALFAAEKTAFENELTWAEPKSTFSPPSAAPKGVGG